MSVRGALINFGFFWHASAALLGGTLSAAALAAQRWRCLGPVLFYCTFGVVIALVKDVPDVAGDRLYGIRSFSVRLGQAQVLRFAIYESAATGKEVFVDYAQVEAGLS